MAHLQVGQPTRVVGRGIILLYAKRLVAVCQRRLQLANDSARPTASVPYRFQIGLKANRVVVVARRAFIIILFQVECGTIDKRCPVIGAELNCFIEIFDRAVVFALLPISYAAVVEWFGVARIELDRQVIILDGAVNVAFFEIGVASIIVCDR